MKLKVGIYPVIILALVAPLYFYPVLLMKVLCFALFACAFNLLIGFTGLLSFGHAAFFGGAGYIAGFVLRDLGLSFELALFAGTGFAAAIGVVIGFLAIRRQGIYFTMITLALAQMIYFIWLRAPFTGGDDGMQGVPRGTLLGVFDLTNDLLLYYIVLAVFLGSYFLVWRIVHSPFGQVLAAIKGNEARAISLGYSVNKYKILAFVLSSALAGLAGASKTVVMGFATLIDAHWIMSGTVILITLVGGLGTFFGPVVGAIIIVALENKLGALGGFLASATSLEWFRGLEASTSIVMGLLFVLCVLAFRRGVVGEFNHIIQRMRKRRVKEGLIDQKNGTLHSVP